MSTRERFEMTEINGRNRLFSTTKTIIETAFYGNNVQAVTDLKMAYELAKKSPKTIVTDQPIKHTSELGLPKDAVMLVDNHGRVVGRTAARRILGRPGVDNAELEAVLREAVYQGEARQFYQAQAIVGLDEEFMLKAHLMVPQGYELNLLSYLLNFQILNAEYAKRYATSKPYSEDDIYLYCDPEWHDPQYPDGLALFDPEHNVAAILGLRYFGELKKATLTLAWATAHRNGYTACHGGEKTFHFKDNKQDKVFAFYGLSGSGKSTLTHAKHAGKFDDITILHDDAFIIDRKNGSSIALEPAYFDKTSDYLPGSKEMEYFTTVMNVGVTQDMQGKKTLVTDDLRNGNGRTIKSRYSAKNRVNHEQAPLDSIFWIMKDDSLPPVVKLSDPVIAATFGLTLATKRSTAENVIGESRDKLVIEPFANPFRVYPLTEDYHDFKELFEKQQANCYIINTDSYNGKNIDKDTTLGILEAIANENADWTGFGALPQMSYLSIPGYEVDLNDATYAKKLRQRLQDRLVWVNNYTKTHPKEELPVEITTKLEELIAKLG